MEPFSCHPDVEPVPPSLVREFVGIGGPELMKRIRGWDVPFDPVSGWEADLWDDSVVDWVAMEKMYAELEELRAARQAEMDAAGKGGKGGKGGHD